MRQQLVEQIVNYQKLIEATLEAIESIPDMGEIRFHLSTSRPGHIALDLPYNIDMFREFRKMLGRNWQMSSTRVDPSGYVATHYNHRETDVKLWVYLEPSLDGTSCKRIKTGTVTQETDVYKVVCE
jgi:hypothetical protein